MPKIVQKYSKMAKIAKIKNKMTIKLLPSQIYGVLKMFKKHGKI